VDHSAVGHLDVAADRHVGLAWAVHRASDLVEDHLAAELGPALVDHLDPAQDELAVAAALQEWVADDWTRAS